MPVLHYAVEIFTDDGTPARAPLNITNGAIGIVAGIFRFVSGRPKYDGTTVVPTYGAGEIDIEGDALTGSNANVFYENFLTKEGISANPVNEIDISRTGDIATLSGLEFVLRNTEIAPGVHFWDTVESYDIALTGRRVKFSIFVDNVMYSRAVLVITNNPFDEVNYKITCGPDLTVHTMIPPIVINEMTFPNVGIGSQITSKVSIGGPVSPTSNIPANVTTQSAPVPICFGDISYAQLFNVEGLPQFEKISYSPFLESLGLNPHLTIAPALATGNGGSDSATPDTNQYHTDGAGSTVYAPGSRFYGPENLYIGYYPGVNYWFLDWTYALFLAYQDLSIVHPSGDFTLSTPEYIASQAYPKGYFKDYYVFKQGDQKGIRILDSYNTWLYYPNSLTSPTGGRSIYTLVLILAEAPESLDDDNMLASQTVGDTPLDVSGGLVTADSTSFFQISKSIIKQVVSNYPILGYTSNLVNGVAPSSGIPILRSFSSNLKLYEDASNMVAKAVATAADVAAVGETINYPYLQLKANSDVQENGISALSPIIISPDTIKSVSWYGLVYNGTDVFRLPSDIHTVALTDVEKLVDRDRSTIFPDIAMNSTGSASGSGCKITITKVSGFPNGPISAISATPSNSGSGYSAEEILNVYHTIARGAKGGMVRIKTVDGSGSVTELYTVPIAGGVDYRASQDIPPPTDQHFSTTPAALGYGYVVTFAVDLTGLVDTDIDKAFFGIDYEATTPDGGGTSQHALSFGLQFRVLDTYGREIDLGDPLNSRADFRDPSSSENIIVLTAAKQNSTPQNPLWNLLPKDYYASGGDDNGESDKFVIASYNADGSGNAFSELDFKKILTLIKNRQALPTLYVDFYLIGSNTDTGGATIVPKASINATISIKQIGFVSQKTISTANKSLFTEVKGEPIGRPWDFALGYPTSKKGDIFYAINKTTQYEMQPGHYLYYNGSIGSDITATPVETNTVYAALKHILQDYDCIPTPLLDLGEYVGDEGNLYATRGLAATNPWYVGRQIQDRKNSLDYIQELCQQSFIGYYISRKGKHTFKSWIDDSTMIATHDNSIILRDTIANFRKTDISSLFNDFNIQYNWNYGLNKFDKSIIVTHIDDADPGVTVLARAGMSESHAPGDGFPNGLSYTAGDDFVGCVDTDGVPLWEKYCSFPGIPKTPIPSATEPSNPEIGDSYYATAATTYWVPGHFYVWNGSSWEYDQYYNFYTDAKLQWDECNLSWKKSFTIQQTSGNLSQMHWYIDRSILSNLAKAATGVDIRNPAYMFLYNAIALLTVQKEMVDYSVPINSDTVNLDLLSKIFFSDVYYTGGNARVAWITKIETDTANGRLNLTIMFDMWNVPS
jgi:hypothetical protein